MSSHLEDFEFPALLVGVNDGGWSSEGDTDSSKSSYSSRSSRSSIVVPVVVV